jgi:putative FmdB family regulatory protein
MPIYEYQCESCGVEFTAIRRITDDTVPACPKCGAAKVQKKISLSAFHLKGSGWYKTDYAKNGSGSGGGGSPKKPGDTDAAPATNSTSSTDKGDKGDTSDTSDKGSSTTTPAAPSPAPEKSST